MAPKPGVIPLRPLGVGEILDGAISYIRGNPAVTLGLSAIVITITQLIQVPATSVAVGRLTGLSTTDDQTLDEVAGAVTSALTSTALGTFLTFVGVTVLTGMLVVALSRAVLGRTLTLGETWAQTRRFLPGVLGLSLLSIVALIALVALGFLPIVLLAVLEAPTAVTVVIGLVSVLAAICGAIFLGVSWSMIIPAYVIEGIPAMSAFRRSFRLVRTQWWRIFGIQLLATIIAGFIGGILATPFSLASGLLDGSLVPSGEVYTGPSLLGLTITAVGTIIGTTITAPFSAGVTGLLYFDQRIRREALDIELARAAGPWPGGGGR